TSVTSGASTTCTVTLNQNAPAGGGLVTLASNNAALPVPGSVTVPAGSSAVAFTATAASVAAAQTATVTATLGGNATATVTITPVLSVPSRGCSPAGITSGGTTRCTVTLNQTAPAGGAVVALASNNAALPVPASLTVLAS